MPDLIPLTNSSSVALGVTVPSKFTPPLITGNPGDCVCGCALTYKTSYGFDVIDFARDVVGEPLDPWQEWTVIHAGELLPDGRPRFRKVLIVVARQNGKTHLCKILALYWLFVEKQELVLGTSTNLDNAKESWNKCVEFSEASQWLRPRVKTVRRANGECLLETTKGAKYKIAAANRKGGRGKTVNKLVLDELREHQTWDAWDASTKATNAVHDAQIFCITNMGDMKSIVLDDQLAKANRFITSKRGDRRFGLFEYSAPENARVDSLESLAMANPNMGRRIDAEMLLTEAQEALSSGGEVLGRFKTEILCQRVTLTNPAIDPEGWTLCGVHPEDAIQLSDYRDRVAVCFDVSLDGSHATAVAAALIDGVTHAEVVGSWDGYDASARAMQELPRLIAKIKPAVYGWFPGGPAAGLAANMEKRRNADRWPPRGVKLEEIKGDAAAVCMGLAEVVKAGQVQHPEDPMLTMHVQSAQKLPRGDAYVYARKGSVPIDGAYALAGAVHEARTLKPRAPLAGL